MKGMGVENEAGIITSSFSLEDGRALKRQRNLSSESEADAEAFLLTTDPIERLFICLMASLRAGDLAFIIAKDNSLKYELPKTVEDTAVDYAQCLILSPSITGYRAGDLAKRVLLTMTQLHVSDIPPSHETGRRNVLTARIGRALTDARCQVKTMIRDSFAEGVKQDIAELTRACISGSKQSPTAALYTRIAFLRAVYKETIIDFIGTTEAKRKMVEKYWPNVDNRLKQEAVDMPVAAERASFYREILETDKRAYPMKAGDTVVPAAKLDEWLMKINENCTANVI
ncbi:hypothetical protein C8J56DRAFT_1120116 [Mycena floridula]|nr:hypothetical protein C8J56DRAFT_1120116 [Mycena floridula]